MYISLQFHGAELWRLCVFDKDIYTLGKNLMFMQFNVHTIHRYRRSGETREPQYRKVRGTADIKHQGKRNGHQSDKDNLCVPLKPRG